MRWIRAFLTLVVLYTGLALGAAEAAGPGMGRVEPAPADMGCGVVPHHGPRGTDTQRDSLPSLDLGDPFDSLTPAQQPVLATSPDAGLWLSLNSLIPALPFTPIQNPDVAFDGRRHDGPTGWPATTPGRLAWLQRLLF